MARFTMTTPTLPGSPRPPYFTEAALLDAYKDAIKGALGAADTAADKILTASVSLAAGYGALLRLAPPKKGPAAGVLFFPLPPFAASAVFFPLPLIPGVPVSATNTI